MHLGSGLRARGQGEPVGLSPVEGLVAKVRNDLEEHQIAEPAQQGVADDGVSGTRSKSGTLHDVADEHGGNQVFAAFQGTDGDLGHLRGRLRLVGLLELLGQLRFELLLSIESGAENAHGEDCVNLNIGRRSRVAVSLSVSSIVHLNLLAESVRQGANGSFGRRVGPVASNRSKGKGGAGEDEMSAWVFHLLTRGDRSQPVAKSGVSHVGSSPVDGVHLLLLD